MPDAFINTEGQLKATITGYVKTPECFPLKDGCDARQISTSINLPRLEHRLR